ncbi:hypothetical protein IAI61_22810 [Roseomonas sp. 573]|uniref:Lipoprotein n=1 Tax=Roseomonas haemaphysalidis TaxID=2768162 RepID=A0ABS3KWL0_9PROT|nr:hypothetical protein [Roseomonas haemaphysalidis]
MTACSTDVGARPLTAGGRHSFMSDCMAGRTSSATAPSAR